MTKSTPCWTRPFLLGLASLLLAACGGGAPPSGVTGPATYQGAIYMTALGSATASATKCVYAFSVSGDITLSVTDSGANGMATGTMNIGVVVTTPSPVAGQSCPQKPYVANQSSNDVSGSYANLLAQAGDAFNAWQFTGAQSGNTLVGTLTLNVTTYDLDGGGSYVTFAPVAISGYVLTQQ